MICQKCGKCISGGQTYIIKFTGIFMGITTKNIACKKCVDMFKHDVADKFPKSIVDSRLKIYKVGDKK